MFFAMLFAQENILLKSDAQAELNGYDYVKNFTVNSISEYFTKDSLNGDVKFFKMPQDFNNVKPVEETVLTIEPTSYIQDVNYRNIKPAAIIGDENDGIYFRGIRVKVNKAPNNIDFSPYSIVYLKEIKVQYDLKLTQEQFEQRKAMKEEWGISDEEELIREKTIARIDIEVKNKEQEKSKMFKEEVSE